jgi:hypothetical protein
VPSYSEAPPPLIGRALALPHVPWHRTHQESSNAPRVMWLWILPPCREGSGLPRCMCSPVGRGPQAQRKVYQACLCDKAHLFPTHTHTFSRCLMSEPSWPCTTCGHAPLLVPMRCADRRLQCGYSAVPALLTTHLAPLQCKVIRQHSATLLTVGGMTGGQDKVCPTPLKTSFATSSR